MSQNHPDRNLHIVLAASAIALVVGAVTGGVGFGVLLGAEHAFLGIRTGALLSQTIVWGSLIFVGVGHILYVNLVDTTDSTSTPSQIELTLHVDPSQVDRQVEFTGTAQPTQTAAKTERFSEVSV